MIIQLPVNNQQSAVSTINNQQSTVNSQQLAVSNQENMIRGWNFWINTLILTSQYNPPWFIEWLMLTLSMIMVGIWLISSQLPYMVLGLSFMVGTSISMLVREAIAPSHQTRITQILALLLLVVSIYWFADLL